MTMNKTSRRQRRGNAIVLVVGILVLLVIIATGYLTRTHAGRVTAVSQQQTAMREDNARVVAQFASHSSKVMAGGLLVKYGAEFVVGVRRGDGEYDRLQSAALR